MDRSNQKCEQICIDDISVEIGDKLYRDGVLYAEVTDISESLYFLKKPHKPDSLPDFYIKDHIVREILFGNLTLQKLTFK